MVSPPPSHPKFSSLLSLFSRTQRTRPPPTRRAQSAKTISTSAVLSSLHHAAIIFRFCRACRIEAHAIIARSGARWVVFRFFFFFLVLFGDRSRACSVARLKVFRGCKSAGAAHAPKAQPTRPPYRTSRRSGHSSRTLQRPTKRARDKRGNLGSPSPTQRASGLQKRQPTSRGTELDCYCAAVLAVQ